MSAQPVHEQDPHHWRLALAGQPVTVDDLVAARDLDEVRTELIDGGLYVTPNPDVQHQRLAMVITVRLMAKVPAGLEVLQGINVISGEGQMLIPDVVVLRPGVEVRAGLGVPPEAVVLAVEITSKSTRRRDFTLKSDVYQEWGVPYVIYDRQGAGDTRVMRFGDAPDWFKTIDLFPSEES